MGDGPKEKDITTSAMGPAVSDQGADVEME